MKINYITKILRIQVIIDDNEVWIRLMIKLPMQYLTRMQLKSTQLDIAIVKRHRLLQDASR